METLLTVPTTGFAPAPRADNEELRRHIGIVSRIARLSELFDAVADNVIVLNKHRQIVYANRAMAEGLHLEDRTAIYGLRPGEALGCQHSEETLGGCGTTRFCSHCGSAKAILCGLRGTKAIEECHLLRGRGVDALDLRVVSTPIEAENESFAVFVMTDISYEKRLQVLERTFLHDISNTVTVLHGVVDLAAETDSVEDADLIRHLKVGVQEMMDAINGHRELLAAENGDLRLHPTSMSSLCVLQEVVALYQYLEIAQAKTIQIAPASVDMPFTTDKTQLVRILANMLKNALEASPPGDRILAGCELERDTQVRFWVQNFQVMAPDVQLQVFNRSFSTKGKGRGIGTYSVKLLGERYLQGKVSFTSAPGEGTIFKVTLPLALS